MRFNRAYKYAMEHSEAFRKHDTFVKEAIKENKESGCLIFTVEPGQTFYYGFDGVDVQKGKHSPKRSVYLLEKGEVLVIS